MSEAVSPLQVAEEQQVPKNDRRQDNNFHKNRPSIGHKVAALERTANDQQREIARLHLRMERIEKDDRVFQILQKMNDNLEAFGGIQPPVEGPLKVGRSVVENITNIAHAVAAFLIIFSIYKLK